MNHSTANHLASNDSNAFELYRYHPSKIAAVIFASLFLLSTIMHIVQASKRKTYYFIPLIVGGIFEGMGYIGRMISSKDQWSLSPFIMQSILLLVAPALFAASIYMIIGRLILLTDGETHAPIRARYLTKIFVMGDVLAFSAQSTGGAFMSKSKTFGIGKDIVITGLVLQIIFFGIFIAVTGIFHRRIVLTPTPASLRTSWKKYLYTLYAASVLILVRSAFRVVEFVMNNDSYIMRHEIFVYLFDGVLMLGVIVLFNVVHPGQIMGRKGQGTVIQLESHENGSGSVGGLADLQKDTNIAVEP